MLQNRTQRISNYRLHWRVTGGADYHLRNFPDIRQAQHSILRYSPPPPGLPNCRRVSNGVDQAGLQETDWEQLHANGAHS
ncbi:Protein of unknown function, partial [Gryllus bimaculatus]